jgi:cell division protein ZapA
MREIRNSGTIIGLERIAVMVALNLCHELQKQRNGGTPINNDSEERLNAIKAKLDSALA